MTALDENCDDLVALLTHYDPAAALGEGWTREYGRLDPANVERATLVYVRGSDIPLRFDISRSEDQPHARRIGPRLWATVEPATKDRRLSGLSAALARVERPEIIRYRPDKRCTFSGADAGARKIFVKSFADERAEDLWRDALALAEAAGRGAFGFETAAPVWLDRDVNALAHAALPGANAAPLLRGDDGEKLAVRIARALATIPSSRVETREVFDAADQMARTRKYAKRFKKCAPHLSPAIARFLQTLDEDTLLKNPAARLLPVHGAPHPQQWLVDGDRLGLVDFDRFGLGHVELDAATFVAELDFENMPAAARNNIGAAFVNEYKRRLGAFGERIFMSFRAQKHFAKAFKTAIAIRPDRLDRAAAILAGAQALLNEGNA